VTVSDGALSAIDTFVVTVTPINDAPTISDISDQTLNEDTATGPLSFTVGDVETAADSLTVTGSSSNPALVPNADIVFGGSGASRNVTVTPATNQSGTATITVTVSDGALSASDTFVVTVTPINDAPTISDVPDQTINEDTATGQLAFRVGDLETDPDALVVSAVSSNQALVPDADLIFGGSGTNRTLTITPTANQSGTASIAVTVSDGILNASTVFVLTVNAVNDPPSISDILDQTVAGSATAPLTFTVSDLETLSASLTVTGVSSNPALVPDANLIFGGSGADRTVTATPVPGQSGTTIITVTVSDGALTASDSFVLTVNPDLPTYLFTEGFEAVGFDNTGWIKHGTPNPDYTTRVLDGAQSLNCSGAQYVERPFIYGDSFYLYFRARWNTRRNSRFVVYWDDSKFNVVASLFVDHSSRLEINHGTASVLGTTPVAVNVTYHAWVEWTRGSGTNGTMKLFVSTTGLKPAHAEATITNGNGGAPSRIYFGPTQSGPNVIFDRILVDDVPIGSNP